MLAVIYAECRVFNNMLCAIMLNTKLQDSECRVFNNVLRAIILDDIYAECRGTSWPCAIKTLRISKILIPQ
jgi:hypothetical protein